MCTNPHWNNRVPANFLQRQCALHCHTGTETHGHRDTQTEYWKALIWLSNSGSVFIPRVNDMCHWTVHYSVLLQPTDREGEERVGRKQTGLKALTGSMCASISTSRQLSHSDHGRFTLRSLKPLPAAALMKKGIYHTQLQWRTTPKKCKACLFVNLYVLVQLRINRVTASGLYRKHCCRLCCRFPAKNASVPRSALLSRSSQGGCHLSYGTQSHIMHTVYTVYEQRNKQTKEKKKEKDRSGNKRAVARTFTTHKTRKRAHAHSLLLPSWARSFSLQQHKSYHAGCQGRERGERGGRETSRKRLLRCNSCIFFSI